MSSIMSSCHRIRSPASKSILSLSLVIYPNIIFSVWGKLRSWSSFSLFESFSAQTFSFQLELPNLITLSLLAWGSATERELRLWSVMVRVYNSYDKYDDTNGTKVDKNWHFGDKNGRNDVKSGKNGNDYQKEMWNRMAAAWPPCSCLGGLPASQLWGSSLANPSCLFQVQHVVLL